MHPLASTLFCQKLGGDHQFAKKAFRACLLEVEQMHFFAVCCAVLRIGAGKVMCFLAGCPLLTLFANLGTKINSDLCFLKSLSFLCSRA